MLGMLGICSTASEAQGPTESDFMQRRTVREGIIEQSKSVMNVVLSG
jgi:hypothetical protein